MNIAIALVLGLLIGWPVEWVIDWFCWQRPQQEIVALPASKPVPTQKVRYKTRPADADDLKKVNGIGPVIKKRLNKAGIYKYEQVAELTLDEFDEALEKVAQRFISSRAIISHSQELADQTAGDIGMKEPLRTRYAPGYDLFKLIVAVTLTVILIILLLRERDRRPANSCRRIDQDRVPRRADHHSPPPSNGHPSR